MVVLKTVERKNPQDLTAPPKYYTQAVANGFVDLERLAYLVSNQCTVREADCLAVLNALQHNVMDELKQGRIVQLGSLGNFQIGVRSEGAEVEAEVTNNQVKSAHVNFRPGKRIRNMLQTLQYKLVAG
ncbi:HU family DNA-binding protein [Marixanthomonas spongiae]|uniref:DNA-binding protein n=1 Tax=Marixanthomonas spongiae TaxID=2174845 RepID=A0A2U0I589_9FLAO|nr:HU family DNA-binding protein [Marixanthomonas spongiae]PVW16266.1 DNA-binding protein [Marixanthomonas spongiae]